MPDLYDYRYDYSTISMNKATVSMNEVLKL